MRALPHRCHERGGQRPACGRAGGARRALPGPGIMRALAAILLLPLPASAQTPQAGWGNLGKEEPKGFSWTDPLFGDFWMAWTAATLAFFVAVLALIALMGLLEWRSPGGNPRHGVLGLDTTRGDRLFISLLGAAWIVLGWLFFFSTPIWGGLALALAWAAFVFWKV
jgi:predicted small integral membrane protein